MTYPLTMPDPARAVHPTRRRVLGAGALAACGLGAPAVRAQQTLRLTLASGYPPVFHFVQEIQRNFAEEMNRELARANAGIRIEWNFALAGTLARIPAMLEAMENGQAEFGHVAHLFAPGKLPLQNVDAYAPFTTPNHRVSAAVAQSLMRDVPAIREQYTRLGLVHLANFALDDYLLFCKAPIASVAALAGRKVGGAGPNLNWLQGTGAVGVTTTGAQAYTDLKNGVFDCLLSPGTFAASGKYHEVAKHIVRVRFNSITGGQIVANKAAFDKLPQPVQRAAQAAALTFGTRYLDSLDQAVATAERTMVSGGAVITEFATTERAKWAFGLPQIAQNWARDIDSKGFAGSTMLAAYMAAVRKAGVEPPRPWDRA